MGRISIVSASAGTGKTHRLATELTARITKNEVRADAIVATTFTNKAADELQARIRSALLKAGRLDDAERLAASRIGTVNSVCGKLVDEFAFDLGLSPELRVLAETEAEAAFARALSEAVTPSEAAELADFDFLLSQEWQEAVEEIVELARANEIEPARLPEFAARSADGVTELLGKTVKDGGRLDRNLREAVRTFVDGVDPAADGTKATRDALADKAVPALRRLDIRGGRIAWREWAGLEKLGHAKKSKELGDPVCRAGEGHDRHPQLAADIRRFLELVFGVASRALEAYGAYKANWGVVDFTDQETLALRILRTPEIRKRLAEEIDLVMVDEFQDTSPIQLAVFIELSKIADESVWVGDQKQAIYGFRGSDPALMDAALEAIEKKGGVPDTLTESYRSRPELVTMTSDLFAKAFARHGIAPEMVRIEPAERMRNEPAGLGPVAEHLSLTNATNKDLDALALAAGVRDLVQDPELKVWDKAHGNARPARLGDVAVLCHKNETCEAVAAALEGLGVPAVIPRSGLMGTFEGRLAAAGLRYWVDPRDSLAAAEIARLTEYPDDGNGWLDRALAKPGIEAFEGMDILKGIVDARAAAPTAGARAALEAVLDAMDVREMCLRWGDAEVRTANLDALRVHAFNYENTCATEGAGCTAAGLAAYLDRIADEEEDKWAVLPAKEAVTVSTWHKSKGLEWPVTVLFVSLPPEPKALGIKLVSDRGGFDFDDPLGGRWIRFWPSPYGKHSKLPFHARLDAHEATAAARDRGYREQLRVLYVIWTRARDRMVLASRAGKLNGGIAKHLADAGGEPLLDETMFAVREASPAEPEEVKPEPGEWYVPPATLPEHKAAFVQPSGLEAVGDVAGHEKIGERLPISGEADMRKVGTAVHGFLAADLRNINEAERLEIARGLLERWDVAEAVRAEDVLAAADAFWTLVDVKWPGAARHREWPVLLRLEGGSVLRGEADLVVETNDGFVVIDHKSFPGTLEDSLEKAAKSAGQLDAYARAIRAATGRPVLATYIHLPVTGVLAEIK